jgi:DNA-directed RNA polymerase subunit RPC12/RpoP
VEQVKQFSCPNCGASLEYEIKRQAFVCKYCDTAYTEEQLTEIYPEKNDGESDDAQQETVHVEQQATEEERRIFEEYSSLYQCPSCGAAIVTDRNTSATKCYYCHSPVVLQGRVSGEYRPSKILPFKIPEETAKSRFTEYCAKRWFLPKGFKQSLLDEVTGIYIPYWTANCTTKGFVRASAENITSWRVGDYRYTKVDSYIAVRAGNMQFERIPADASAKADDSIMENLEPFDYNAVVDFKMSYLSGFLADKYDVTKDEVLPRIKQRAETSAKNVLSADISGYDSVRVTSSDFKTTRVCWEHMLFPIWFLSYKYKDKIYKFAMNGQTGKFAGELPINMGKLALVCGIIIAVAAGIGFLIAGEGLK